jgi:hypothetical protein
MAIRLEREALYRAIWSKPLRAVALDYGLSDTGLRKVCVALNVPMPPRGYWARKAAGQAVESVPLPETDGATTFVSRPQSRTPDQEWRTAEDERWFAERIAFDVSQRETLTVSERPARWHPVVAKLRDLLVEHEAELLKSRAAAERHARLPESRRQREGDSAGYLWRYANDHGQLVFDPSHAFAVRVSIGHFRRALVYLNAVARLAEARGYAVSYDSKEGRIVLDAQPGRVELRMSEKMEKRTRREGSRGDAREVVYLVPTGVLRVFVAVRPGSIREMSDRVGETTASGDALRLEQRLPELLQSIYRQTVQSRMRQRRIDAMHAQREAAYARQQQAERLRAEEQQRRERLLGEIRAWQQAEAIRAYVRGVELASGMLSEARGDWRTWALAFADELDPIRGPGRE